MKKIVFFVILFTFFMIGINVKAKYAEYKSDDYIMIGNYYYVVVGDSSDVNDKLKLMPENNQSNSFSIN